MSTTEGKTEDPKRSRRQRNRRRGAGAKKTNGEAGAEAKNGEEAAAKEPKAPKEPKEPKPVPVSAPVPEELMGTSQVGRICDVTNRTRGKFGFIFIGLDEEKPRAETPRIYFSFKEYSEDNKFPPRRGYQVSFTCGRDEEDRACAKDIKITPEGLVLAEERDAKYLAEQAAKKERAEKAVAEKPAANGEEKPTEGGEKKKRVRKRAVDERELSLTVTCEGKADEKKVVVAKLAESIGKLKHTATVAYDAPISYSVYCQITPENPEGTLLTKAILKTLAENELIHLKEPPAEAS